MLDNINLKFRKYGENGINFTILHRLFGSGRNWTTFASSLKQTFQFWTLDARNHGASPHSDQMNYESMSLDVMDFFKKNNIKKLFFWDIAWGENCDAFIAKSSK